MKIFIPPLTTKLQLEEPWTFGLYSEHRNDKFIDILRHEGYQIPHKNKPANYWSDTAQLLCNFTLPPGTILSVQRIYIRMGQKGFDSVSFAANVNLCDPSLGKFVIAKGRFWAKLEDVNTINATVL